MFSLTCHSCDETIHAATKEALLPLAMQHAEKHGHTPPIEHVRARIRKHNA